ncbi:MAG: ECF transporter S component [Erysipelotrichaceae bacterium]
MNNKVKLLSYTAIMIALVCVTTMFLSFPVGSLGYLNLGDVVIMIGASIFGPIPSFLFGGLGSAFADIFLNYSQYAVFSFLIKGSEGLVFSYLFSRNKEMRAYLAVILILLLGYGAADVILTGSFASLLPSVFTNSIQALSSVFIALLLVPMVSKRLRKQIHGSK